MQEPKIAVVIVEYRERHLSEACIASLRMGTFRNFTVFLIDNTPGSGHAYNDPDAGLPEGPEIPKVRYVATGKNLGFCGGCNIGIDLALTENFDYVLILNYDTIAAPDFLERLASRAGTLGELGILGAKIHYQIPEKRIWDAGGRLSRLLGVGKHNGYGELDQGAYDVFGEVSYVTGCCMLVPTEVFRRAGPFKDELFMYLDDAEFCLRITALGLKLYYEPAAVLTHRVGPGFGKRNFPDYYLYFSIRNKPWITEKPLFRAYLIGFTIVLAAAKLVYYGAAPGIRDRGRKIRAIALGLWDSFSVRAPVEKRFPRLFATESRT